MLLCTQHRRSMGRSVSVNLDDALTMEPVQQFPIGPAMPIKVPSGPPPPESSSAESVMARATSGTSALSNPSNNAYVRSSLMPVFYSGITDMNIAMLHSCLGTVPCGEG